MSFFETHGEPDEAAIRRAIDVLIDHAECPKCKALRGPEEFRKGRCDACGTGTTTQRQKKSGGPENSHRSLSDD